jgi:signal transduction histidine kinase
VKIGQRLALKFTVVSALLTGVILLVIYNVARKNVHDDFIERLTKQSSLEVLHFATPDAKDVIPPGSFLLINPLTSIFDSDGKLAHQSGDYPGHSRWVGSVPVDEVLREEEGDYTTIGKRYTINGKTYIVFVSDKDLPGQNELDIFLRAIITGWVLSIMLSYGAGLYYAGNALGPVKNVLREVNQITKDNLGYRLTRTAHSGKPDELEELILTFNALLDRIESAFNAQKRFVQHASHEIKTPLTTIMGEAELALVRDRHADEYKRTLTVVVSETERLVNITQGLLTLARFEEGYYNSELENVGLRTIVTNALSSFRGRYPHRQLTFDGAFMETAAYGNVQLLQIAISNLIDNALKYSEKDVSVELVSGVSDIMVRIRDHGIGIPESDLQKVKSPMYRATNVQAIPGAGLGLSLVQRIAEFHKGKLVIESEVNVGTTTTVSLPRSTSQQRA